MLGSQHKKSGDKQTAQREIYSTTHIGPIGVRVGLIEGRIGLIGGHVEVIGGRVEYTRLFGYQHVGIGNATVLWWRSIPTRIPNANPFAFWWNISLRVLCLLRLSYNYREPVI